MIATQHSLVARLRENPCDSDWEKFYRLYEKPILAVAAAKGLGDADCQDVLQETMVRMCRHGFVRYDPTRRFTPFLFGIAKDCAFDALRRRARRSSHEVPIDPSQAVSFNQQKDATDKGMSPADAAEIHGQLALVGVVLDFLWNTKLSRQELCRCLRRSFLNSEIQMTSPGVSRRLAATLIRPNPQC